MLLCISTSKRASLSREGVLDGSGEYKEWGAEEWEAVQSTRIFVTSVNGSLPELDTCYSSASDFYSHF